MSNSPNITSYCVYLAHRIRAHYINMVAELPPYLRALFSRHGDECQPRTEDVFTARAFYPLDVVDHLDEVIDADRERLTPLPNSDGSYSWQILHLDATNNLHVEVVVLRHSRALPPTDVRIDGRIYHFGAKTKPGLWSKFSPLLLILLLALPPLKVQWELHQRQEQLEQKQATLEQDTIRTSPQARLRNLLVAQRRLNSTPSVLALLDNLSQTLPQNTWLLSLTIEDVQADLVGLAPSASDVLSALSANAIFQNIAPQGATRIEGEMERFHMRATMTTEGDT